MICLPSVFSSQHGPCSTLTFQTGSYRTQTKTGIAWMEAALCLKYLEDEEEEQLAWSSEGMRASHCVFLFTSAPMKNWRGFRFC